MNYLHKIHEDCHAIFKSSFYNTDEQPNGSRASFPSKACKVYYKLTEDGNRTDCIGENFNQIIHRMNSWFANYKPDELDFYFFNYIILLYLFVERVDFIFEVINPKAKTKLFNDFKHENFKTLVKIKKWANFIKHPKEFLFTHWATYYIEGEISVDETSTNERVVRIDTGFIFNHYTSESCESPIILANNDKVYVEVPKLESLTSDFCKEINTFFEFICSNQIVANYLKKKSTIENYFEQIDIDSVD